MNVDAFVLIGVADKVQSILLVYRAPSQHELERTILLRRALGIGLFLAPHVGLVLNMSVWRGSSDLIHQSASLRDVKHLAEIVFLSASAVSAKIVLLEYDILFRADILLLQAESRSRR